MRISETQSCDSDFASQLYILPEGMQTDDFNEYDLNIDVQYVSHAIYRVSNSSHNHFPFIYFEIPKDQSILAPLYSPTTVVDDDSLKAELVRRDHEWILHLQGQIKICPGKMKSIFHN